MLNDTRFAFRQLAKSPGFTLVALITLALGIGATTAIFTVVNSVLLRPLDFPHPEQLVVIEDNGRGERAVSPPNFIDWRNSSSSFAAMTAIRGFRYNLTGGNDPQRLLGARVTHGYFDVFGVAPLLGRTLRADEDAPGANLVLVLSYGFWQRQFGGASSILDRTLQLNGETYTVVGVMPADFQRNSRTDFWTPMAFAPAELTQDYRNSHFLRAYGRVKPGVSVEQAQIELTGIARQLEEAFPDSNKGHSVRLVPLHEFTVGSVRQVLVVLLGAVGCVLLIACANLANLQLAGPPLGDGKFPSAPRWVPRGCGSSASSSRRACVFPSPAGYSGFWSHAGDSMRSWRSLRIPYPAPRKSRWMVPCSASLCSSAREPG